MDSIGSETVPDQPDPARRSAGAANRPTISTKIVIAGGFGVGKTTLVGSVSEIVPLRTEAAITDASTGVDDLRLTPGKSSTTVAMDFGRLSLDSDLVLYLFGTPGQHRFWFMWDDLVRGAIGAVVLLDTRRIADSFAAIDFFEDRELPYVIAVNCFDGELRHELDDIREALSIEPTVPIITCDARDRNSTRDALIAVVQHAMWLRAPQEAHLAG